MLNLLTHTMYFTDASFQVDLEALVVTKVDPVGLVDPSKLQPIHTLALKVRSKNIS